MQHGKTQPVGNDVALKMEEGGQEPRNTVASRSLGWPSVYSQQEHRTLVLQHKILNSTNNGSSPIAFRKE